MGFILEIKGSDSLTFGKEIIRMVNVSLASPSDSKAKATNNYSTMWINGKLDAEDSGSKGDALKLFEWAQMKAGDADVYRDVTVQIETNSICLRKINFPNAFVVDYSERYTDTSGMGGFTIVIRQKADKVDDVKVEGGMPLAAALDGGEGAGGEGKKKTAMGRALSKVGEIAASTVKSGVLQSTLIGAGSAAAVGAVNYAMKKKDPTGVAAATLGRAITEVTTFTNQKVGTPSKTAAAKAAKAATKEKSASKGVSVKAAPARKD